MHYLFFQKNKRITPICARIIFEEFMLLKQEIHTMPLPKENTYTTDYIYSLPEGQRAELIDGVIYDMAPQIASENPAGSCMEH